MSVVLIGYRGSGKTSIGRTLAQRLWQEFVDTDELIVRALDMSIREIFQSRGEAGFRELEAQALADALKTAAPAASQPEPGRPTA